VPRQTKSQIQAAAIRLGERRAEAYRMWITGKTQTFIAAHFGIDQSVVSDDLKRFRDSIPEADRDQARKDQLSRLQGLRDSLYELATKDGAPVTSGKDGLVVLDPATREVVRDYSLRVQATREISKLDEREAKLLGLNAADKVELSGSIAIVGSVEQELQKLADELGLNDPSAPAVSTLPAEQS
jgi:hypothetical protein